jgi:uncharacterized membrane protein
MMPEIENTAPSALIETQSLEGPPAPEEHAAGLPPAAQGDRAVADMEAVVARVLRWGVALSFIIVLSGAVWLFATRAAGYGGLETAGRGALSSLTRYTDGHNAQASPSSPAGAVRGIQSGKPYAIIMLGLLVLIATPVVRVAVSVATFLWDGDRLYALITAYVLAVLVVSFAIGKGV